MWALSSHTRKEGNTVAPTKQIPALKQCCFKISKSNVALSQRVNNYLNGPLQFPENIFQEPKSVCLVKCKEWTSLSDSISIYRVTLLFLQVMSCLTLGEHSEAELVNISLLDHRSFVWNSEGFKSVRQMYEIALGSPLVLSSCPTNYSFMEQFQHVYRWHH